MAEIVEEKPDLPRTEIEEAGLPAVPEDLSREKKRNGGLAYGISRHVRWERIQTRQHPRD